jgi:hypothetical protein
MLEKIRNNKSLIICVAIVLIVFGVAMYFYIRAMTTTQEQPKVMQYEQTTDPEKVKNTLDVSDKTADQIVKRIEYIHDGITPASATYYVTAPTLAKAADTTASEIKTAMETGNNTNNLPTAAVEKTDRTVVTANTDQQKVDVYKIDLDKQHQIKVGAGAVDGHMYEVVSYQAGRWEVPIVAQGKNIKGGSILYTVAKW